MSNMRPSGTELVGNFGNVPSCPVKQMGMSGYPQGSSYLGHFGNESVMAMGHNTTQRFKNKMEMTMHEFKHGTLHSGSKHGPKVRSRKQAIAIALSQARKER